MPLCYHSSDAPYSNTGFAHSERFASDLRSAPPEVQRATLEARLNDPALPEVVRELITARLSAGKASVKKYDALLACTGSDGRLRGCLQFMGAVRTGRWTGRLFQPQNLPRNYLETLDHARECVRSRQLDALKIIYGNLSDTLSQLIRTAFIPSPGHKLIVADFSAIEARVIAWLAQEKWRLDVFATHGKIYEASASQMFGVPLELIKKGNPEYELRQKGKVAELALGYQGGPGALTSMGALNMGLTEEELPEIVQRWRSANKRIVDLWYSLERAAVEVVRTGEPAATHGLFMAREADSKNNLDFLTITLPSGRKLFYWQPFLHKERQGKESLYYWGINQTTQKWERIPTYGGKLVENCVQSIARDCLADALVKIYVAGYNTVMHVHDEVVLDVPDATEEDLNRVIKIMEQPLPWAPGLVLRADGFLASYYQKN